MAGCKGRALRLAGEDCKNIRGMILRSDDSLPAPVCRGRKTLLGVPRGQSPLASLAKEKMPIGVFDEAVQCGLPLAKLAYFFSVGRQAAAGGGGKIVLLRFAREEKHDAGMESMNISSEGK